VDCLGATLDFIGRPETGSRGTQGLLKARGGNARGRISVKRFYFNRLVLQRYASVILFHCASLKLAIKPRIDERYLQSRGIIFGSNMQVERSRKSKPHPCGLLCVDPLQKSRCVERIRASQFA